MTRTVLVTGARGKTGREVVRRLRHRPEVVVRAGSSKPDWAPTLTGHPVGFDWRNPAPRATGTGVRRSGRGTEST
jgi:uncharacterized protein YbjT (DUF2867 family)